MYFLRRNHDFRKIHNLVRLYSIARKSHYDVLNLRRNCTDKEIKEAFIQLSKEYHPDKNKDVKAQEKFVRIVEAYNVLSKPSSRSNYDHMSEVASTGAPYVYKSHNFRKTSNYNYYYETPNKERNVHENTNFYGFNGIKKLPNYYIILICFGVALIGVILQVFVIRNMYVLQRSKAQERSRYLSEELDKVRRAAQDNGNELQTRLLLDKIVSAANPTVTTASLGQALANEKK